MHQEAAGAIMLLMSYCMMQLQTKVYNHHNETEMRIPSRCMQQHAITLLETELHRLPALPLLLFVFSDRSLYISLCWVVLFRAILNMYVVLLLV